MPKIITIDCDNVLADTAGSFVNRYMTKTGTPLSIDEFDQQYLSQCAVLQGFVKKVGDPYIPFWKDVIDAETMTEILPVEGSVDAMKILVDSGFECVMVTGRGQREYEETYRRVDQWFPGCFKDIVFGYECTSQHIDKGTLCEKLGSLVHVDDFIQNAQIISQVGIPTLLFDRSRNQHEATDALITRVSGWEESLARIDENVNKKN